MSRILSRRDVLWLATASGFAACAPKPTAPAPEQGPSVQPPAPQVPAAPVPAAPMPAAPVPAAPTSAAPVPAAPVPEVTMNTRPIPKTKEAIPTVGLGTWQAFDVDASRRAPLVEVVKQFLAAGGRVIDSSPMYGRAEAIVGDVLADLGAIDTPFLATKVWTRGKREGIAQMEQSRRRMRPERSSERNGSAGSAGAGSGAAGSGAAGSGAAESGAAGSGAGRGSAESGAGGPRGIDLMQIHNLLDWQTHLPVLREMKQAGAIRYLGVTHYSHGEFPLIERLMRTEALDFIQIPYNVADRAAEARVLPAAADTGTAVLVMRPFDEGGLFRRVRGKPLPSWAADLDCTSWAQLFLKFIIGHPAVTCPIPATADPAHLADNMKAGTGRLPDAAQRHAIVSALDA